METLLERINELARKQKTNGLTDPEKAEQARLRQEYLARFRQNFATVLDNTVIMDAEGSKTPLQRKKGGEKPH